MGRLPSQIKMRRGWQHACNDVMAVLVSCMIWGSMLIVSAVVFWPWRSWESASGCALLLVFGTLR